MGKIDKNIAQKKRKVLNSYSYNPLEIYTEGLSDEEIKILHNRAVELSNSEKEIKHKEEIEIIYFYLGEEKFGLQTKYTLETLKLEKFTELPSAPDLLLGIFSLRGNLISILDFKILFGIQASKSDKTNVIVIGEGDFKFGILVDIIDGVSTIDSDLLTSKVSTIKGAKEKYLLGVTSEGITILDGQKILKDQSLIINN